MTERTELAQRELLERDRELEAIGAALTAARDGAGSCLIVEGSAGVGKTALILAARAATSARDLMTLHARGSELERSFAFGVVRQLFEPVVNGHGPELGGLFTGPARLAAQALDVGLDGDAPRDREDPYAALHGLHWLTANLADRCPVAIIVDDAHWADAASLRFLDYVARRVANMAVLVMAATRTGEPGAEIESVRRLPIRPGANLRLEPLSAAATEALVCRLIPRADEALCRVCHAATGGNPLFLHELVRSLAQEGGHLDVARVIDHSPERVTREVAARLRRIPEPAGRLARAAAVLGDGAPLKHGAAVACLGAAEASEAADMLCAVGILQPSRPLAFVHPILRAAVYDALSAQARSTGHAQAARLLAQDGASPERIAAHLLACDPAGDPWTCQRLVEAASPALARGAPTEAVAYLTRALCEPPPAGYRPVVLLELGMAESLADPAAAIDHLGQSLAEHDDRTASLQAAMLLTSLLAHQDRAAEAVEVLEQQLERFADHPVTADRIEARLVNVSRLSVSGRVRAGTHPAAILSRAASGEPCCPEALACAAAEMAIAGERADDTVAMAQRALGALSPTSLSYEDWSVHVAGRTLTVCERFDEAHRVLDDALAQARQRGAAILIAFLSCRRADLLARLGDLAGAELDARAAHTVSGELGWSMGLASAAAVLVEVLTQRGETDEAAALIAETPWADAEAALPDAYAFNQLQHARGSLHIAQGRIDEGIADLLGCGRRLTELGELNPALCPWRSGAALALHLRGGTANARRLVCEELELARAFGAPRALGVALRAAGVVEGGDAGIRLLTDAVGVLEGSPASLERARALAKLGTALRLGGHNTDARDPLRRALELAHRCGARPLEERVLAELRAAGGRPRRPLTTGQGALTPSERRVAELAASGLSNPCISEQLFVSLRTVEFHLANAYRKLNIGSRTELREALGELAPGD